MHYIKTWSLYGVYVMGLLLLSSCSFFHTTPNPKQEQNNNIGYIFSYNYKSILPHSTSKDVLTFVTYLPSYYKQLAPGNKIFRAQSTVNILQKDTQVYNESVAQGQTMINHYKVTSFYANEITLYSTISEIHYKDQIFYVSVKLNVQFFQQFNNLMFDLNYQIIFHGRDSMLQALKYNTDYIWANHFYTESKHILKIVQSKKFQAFVQKNYS